MTPRVVTILVDSREKRPLFFPKSLTWYPDRGGKGHPVRIETKRKALKTGDYAIRGHENLALIERKAGPSELSNNLLGDDHKRAEAAFARLTTECVHPYLLLACTPAEMYAKSIHYDPERVMDALCELVNRLNIRLIWAGQTRTQRARYRLGELVTRILMGHAYRPTVETCDVQDIVSSRLSSPSRRTKPKLDKRVPASRKPTRSKARPRHAKKARKA